MAFSHGKDFVFKIGTAGIPGTPVDISQYLTGVSFPREKETAETTTMGKASKTRIAGLVDGSISIEGNYDPTVDAQLEALLEHTGTPPSFDIKPQVAGISYTGQCICTSYEVNGDVGSQLTFSAEFEITGDVARV